MIHEDLLRHLLEPADAHGRCYGVVVGVVSNEGISIVQTGGRDHDSDIRAAIAELVRVANADPLLPTDQATALRERAKDLQVETAKKPKRWNRDTVRTLLTDISQLAATTVATAGAAEAVKESLGPLIR